MTERQSGPVGRRQFLARFGAGTLALVAGFDLLTRQWVTEAAAADGASFATAPPLDGTLVFDAESLAANAHDQGNIMFRTPCAVLRPGSVQDIRKMVGFCADHGMRIGLDGVQLLGGHGYVKEHPVERWYRDLRAVAVMEGGVLV